jgi:hypothetical protein
MSRATECIKEYERLRAKGFSILPVETATRQGQWEEDGTMISDEKTRKRPIAPFAGTKWTKMNADELDAHFRKVIAARSRVNFSVVCGKVSGVVVVDFDPIVVGHNDHLEDLEGYGR